MAPVPAGGLVTLLELNVTLNDEFNKFIKETVYEVMKTLMIESIVKIL